MKCSTPGKINDGKRWPPCYGHSVALCLGFFTASDDDSEHSQKEYKWWVKKNKRLSASRYPSEKVFESPQEAMLNRSQFQAWHSLYEELMFGECHYRSAITSLRWDGNIIRLLSTYYSTIRCYRHMAEIWCRDGDEGRCGWDDICLWEHACSSTTRNIRQRNFAIMTAVARYIQWGLKTWGDEYVFTWRPSLVVMNLYKRWLS